MKNPDNTIESTALQCGFHDAKQLRRLWKKYFGTTPSQYRHNLDLNINVLMVTIDNNVVILTFFWQPLSVALHDKKIVQFIIRDKGLPIIPHLPDNIAMSKSKL